MKKIFYFLLLLSFYSYGSSKSNNLGGLVTETAIEKNIWKIYDSDSGSITPKGIESTFFILIDARVTQNQFTTQKTHYNYKRYFELVFSESCKVKIKSQKIIFVPFCKTDIIFPFHTYW
jgi:hypothetical protein